MPEIVKLENVTVRFGRLIALRDISGGFHEGSLTAIAGPNGAGKSTLLKLIVGAVKPHQGRIFIKPSVSISYLPQATSLRRDFPLSVMQAACTGFWETVGNAGGISKAMRQRASQALAEVGLSGFEDRQIAELSGGQFQRLLFARVVLQDARLILLDEPFAAIDADSTNRLIQIILNWHRQGRTIICVLHDLLMIQKYFPDSFVLAGRCLGHGHTHQLLEQKLLSFDLDMAELCAGSEDHAHGRHN